MGIPQNYKRSIHWQTIVGKVPYRKPRTLALTHRRACGEGIVRAHRLTCTLMHASKHVRALVHAYRRAIPLACTCSHARALALAHRHVCSCAPVWLLGASCSVCPFVCLFRYVQRCASVLLCQYLFCTRSSRFSSDDEYIQDTLPLCFSYVMRWIISLMLILRCTLNALTQAQ